MLYTLRMFWARSLLNRVIVLSLVGLFCCCPTLAGLNRGGNSPTTLPTPASPQTAAEATVEATAEPLTATVAPTVASEVTVPSAEPTVPPAPAEPVPLTVEGLTSILILPGDLPEGWSGDDLFEESPVDYEGPTPQVVLSQGLLEPDAQFASGRVILWVFANVSDARTAYQSRYDLIQRVVDADAERLTPPIGDQSLLVPGKGTIFITNQVLFQRCNAVVEINLGNSTQVDWTNNFANRLDLRLKPSVCK